MLRNDSKNSNTSVSVLDVALNVLAEQAKIQSTQFAILATSEEKIRTSYLEFIEGMKKNVSRLPVKAPLNLEGLSNKQINIIFNNSKNILTRFDTQHEALDGVYKLFRNNVSSFTKVLTPEEIFYFKMPNVVEALKYENPNEALAAS